MVAEPTTNIVTYDVTEAQIALTRQMCASLTADTPAGYEEVRVAIARLRDTRSAIERRRVELKADALAFGRLVDSEAKRFTGMLAEIEDPLKAKKAAVDDEKARIKAEAEAVRVRALEAEIRANVEQQEAERRAEREAEEARLAAERAELEAERARAAEERRIADAKALAEREAAEAKLAAECATLAEERRQADEAQRVERERARVQREVEEAALRAERDAVEAASIRALVPPKTRTKDAKAMVSAAVDALEAVAATLTTAARQAA